jgi:hypothetical protein
MFSLSIAVMVLGGIGLCVAAFFVGRDVGRQGALDRLDRDVYLRREVLEHLAQVEGMKLVGHE